MQGGRGSTAAGCMGTAVGTGGRKAKEYGAAGCKGAVGTTGSVGVIRAGGATEVLGGM